MKKRREDKIQGWEISLTRHVHMYCHALTVKKGQHEINIQCEDLAIQDRTVGMWLYDLYVSREIKEELRKVLLRWTGSLDERFRIYTGRNEFVESK